MICSRTSDRATGRRIGVERRHPVVGVAPERVGDGVLGLLCDVVALPHVVEVGVLHHEVVEAGLSGAQDGKAVVAAVDVEEVQRDGVQAVVAKPMQASASPGSAVTISRCLSSMRNATWPAP